MLPHSGNYNRFYFILRPDSDSMFLLLAEPWTRTWTDTRISFTVTHSCFLSAMVIWVSCTVFLMTGGYYLRSGFIDLHKAMQDDQEIVSHLSNYKHQHMCLSDLTAALDRMFKAYIGTALAMATFDMCLQIFTLGDDKKGVVLLGSISLLCVTLNTLLMITVMSISLNSWVMVLHLTPYVYLLLYLAEKANILGVSCRSVDTPWLLCNEIWFNWTKLSMTQYNLPSPDVFHVLRSHEPYYQHLVHMVWYQCVAFITIFGYDTSQ